MRRCLANVFACLDELRNPLGMKHFRTTKSGRALLRILNRIAQLRACLKSFHPKTSQD